MLASFSAKVVAEMDSVICCYESQIRLGMRENRAFAKKREGEDDGVGVRRWTFDAGKGSRGIMLDGGLLVRSALLASFKGM